MRQQRNIGVHVRGRLPEQLHVYRDQRRGFRDAELCRQQCRRRRPRYLYLRGDRFSLCSHGTGRLQVLKSTITITAFERSPDGGKGLARDTRVRWALEEVGQPYEVRPVSFRALKEPAHLALHPFGKIPTYEEGDLVLFESGAIVLHIAERHAGLLPADDNARARAITWMFAALSTVEPPILELVTAKLLEGDKPWRAERLPLVEGRIRERLDQLSARLGNADRPMGRSARAT